MCAWILMYFYTRTTRKNEFPEGLIIVFSLTFETTQTRMLYFFILQFSPCSAHPLLLKSTFDNLFNENMHLFNNLKFIENYNVE